MIELIKQIDPAFIDPPYDAISTDGCLFRSLQAIAETAIGVALTEDEIKRAFHYAIPDYMEDHRNVGNDRCYILKHEEIIRVAFYILGYRYVSIEYKYRKDDVKMIIGTHRDFYSCNYWIGKCLLDSGGSHFYLSNLIGNVTWNPHVAISEKLTSLRGYRIKILEAA